MQLCYSKQRLKTADVKKIYNDADSKSTAVLATKIDIGSESDMTTSARRSLAECLHRELYSEAIHNKMYTGNEEGLVLAGENARIPILESKIDGLQEQIKDLDSRFSKLQSEFDQLRDQRDVRFTVGYADIRNRFLSTYRRDVLGAEPDEVREVIKAGNSAAHNGSLKADAMLYRPEGFSDGYDRHIPPRTDRDTFESLYGVDPSVAEKIVYTSTILLLERHATVCASIKHQPTTLFEETFQAFVRALKETNYASGYLEVQSAQVAELVSAYREFWKASGEV
ncbi:hypothetical protein AbraIFM66951_006460 [Aspergillus brasiliensis]|uniref:Uncharacterized protein n=1 Tax=Aspergillus brasiliensis TaxID=319629 RepID=A0A9W5YRJ8_9EURO|nr:hypothetical protein AbraCBS73388_008716 [Aspergillus brasiliensis]GKZ40921.1 hypothetical protein AbraIFM66951_006460 [Aspergillus brasiliensis]